MDCKWNDPSPSLYICSAAFWAEALQSITSDNNLHLLIGMHQAENKLLISELFLNSEHDLQPKWGILLQRGRSSG